MTDNNGKPIIMIDQPDLATKTTVEAWKTPNGEIFTGERAARYSICTHVPCNKCGKPVQKSFLTCDECRHKAELARYVALPTKKWDGVAPLYSSSFDEYFFDEGALTDFIEENEIKDVSEMCLVFAEPEKINQIDIDNWDLHEDYIAPKEVVDAVKALNLAIAAAPPHCWYPGKVAAEVELNHG